MEVRRLGVGDEEVLRQLSIETARFDEERAPTARACKPHTIASAREFLSVPSNFQLAAFADGEPVGLLLAYELIRRHGDGKMMFTAVPVSDGRSSTRSETFAASGAISRAFVMTNERNAGAMAFYRSLGATRDAEDEVVFGFDWS